MVGSFRRTNSKAKLCIKGAHIFGCHESNERSWACMLFQIGENSLHEAFSQPFAFKGGQHDDILKIKIQSPISNDPSTANDFVVVQEADREQGIGKSSGCHLFVGPPPADRFTQGEIVLNRGNARPGTLLVA